MGGEDFCGHAMPAPAEIYAAVSDMISTCAKAWKEGLMEGWSGNASIRLSGGLVLITATGAAKGALRPEDCLLADKTGAIISGNGKPSSESAMHMAVYQALPASGAILHAHPPLMQALGLIMDNLDTKQFAENFLRLNLFESRMWLERLDVSEAATPGTKELASGVALCLERPSPLPRGVWMRKHGLCAIADTLGQALALTEELEYLARIQLKCLQATKPG